MSGTGADILSAMEITLKFGGVVALDGVSVSVPKGAIMGLVGPNGAGKTTLLNAISGVFPLTAGTVTFEGKDVTGVPLHRRVRLGIGRTFQGVELFHDLSVQENMMVGRHHLMRTGVLTGGLFFGPARAEEVAHRRRVEEFIEFFELERYRKKPVGALGYGIQKIVGVARAMCSEPRLLLLDEVAAGLNREEKENLARFMLRLKHSFDVTMIWVEHDVRMVAELTDLVAVLDYGRLVKAGQPEDVLRDPQVRDVFLGPANKDLAGAVRPGA
ncbi:MAG: ABC transporter ATP-binding protein [Alphaproteobacteria bacterium]|nr:ABC transporter ATP-binding protein [Alphaproteobacteria bacterium]